MAKITRATFKSYINKNYENLYVRKDSDFDGMYDCVTHKDHPLFQKASESVSYKGYDDHTLCIEGIYLVGDSRDYFKEYEDDDFKGIEYSNCCGSGVIAVKKNEKIDRPDFENKIKGLLGKVKSYEYSEFSDGRNHEMILYYVIDKSSPAGLHHVASWCEGRGWLVQA